MVTISYKKENDRSVWENQLGFRKRSVFSLSEDHTLAGSVQSQFADANHFSEPVAEISDERLMRLVQVGDQAALGSLVERHQGRFLGRAFNITHHVQDAEDVVQDSFIKLWQRAKSWNSDLEFQPWFFRVVSNTARDSLRRKPPAASDAFLEAVRDTQPSPDVMVEIAEEISLMERSLQKDEGQKAKSITGKHFRLTITREQIIESGWAEKIATGRRPTGNDRKPIIHGPLAGMGLSWARVQVALVKGRYGLEPCDGLPWLFNEAGIPEKDEPISKIHIAEMSF